MTHSSTEQPEALRLADLSDLYGSYRSAWDIDASAELRRQFARIAELETALKKANAQAEHFEREWYLRGDELEALQAQREPLSDAQICDALGIDGSDDWTYTVARAVEAAHGITNQKCTGCAGVGLVGGLTRDGYVSDECPFCAGTGVDNSTTQEKCQ